MFKTRRLRGGGKLLLLPALALLMSAVRPAQAAPACTTFTNLAQYIASPCSIGNMIFTFSDASQNFFAFDSNGDTIATSAIHVTVVGTGLPGSDTGLQFTTDGGFSVTNTDGGFDSGDLHFNFTVQICTNAASVNSCSDANDGGFSFETASLSIQNPNTIDVSDPNAAVNPTDAQIAGGESISDSHNPSPLPGSLGINMNLWNPATPGVTNSPDPQTVFFTAGPPNTFPTGHDNFIQVTKDFQFLSIGQVGLTTKVNTVTETFTTGNVPEPGPMVLLSAGIGALLLLRRRKHLLGFLGALALMFLVSGNAKATPVCQPHTLAFYENPDPTGINGYGTTGCTIGDQLFQNFSYSVTASGTTQSPTTAQINVSPIVAALNNGFNFATTTAFSALGNSSLTINVSFNVSTPVGKIEDLTAGYQISHSGTGAASGTVTANPPGGGSATVTLGNISGTGTSPANFAPQNPGTIVTISNVFHLTSTGTLANSAHLSGFFDQISETTAVPEPVSAMLIGGGLLALGVGMRRLKKQRP